MSGNPRCDYCLKPQRAAVVRVRTHDGNASRPDSQVEVRLCSMHFARARAMAAVGEGPRVDVIEWINEVARRRWEEDVAAGLVPG